MTATHKAIRSAVMTAIVFASGSASAQVVQLPSIQTFSYSGSVLVPDSGGAYLGGNSSSAYGSVRRGGQRAWGGRQAVAGMSAHVTVIDLDAMDREILGYDPKKIAPPSSQPVDSPRSGVAKSAASKAADKTEEGKALVRYARDQFRRGNEGAAFDAYRLAISLLAGDLKQYASDEFRRVFPTAAPQVARLGR